MTDRKKVMNALEMCIANDFCNRCPYESACFNDGNIAIAEQLMRDALFLLKEQEAVEPVEEFIKDNNCHKYHCKRCGNIVGTILGGKHPIFPGVKLSIKHFCDVCGQVVKWNA